MTAPHHVIVGGSAAGVAAALAMRRNGFEGRITLVEAASEEPYERPPLSKSFIDLDAPRRILPPSTYVEEDIDLLLGMPVAALDVDRKVVRLPDGEGLGADAVLVATGVNARRLGVPGEYLEHVLVLRGLADARALAARLDVGGPWVIVGGGFIGLEAAAVARGRGIDVTVVEAMPVPLAGVLGPALAAHVQRMHEREGVRILGGRTVTEFVGEREVEKVVLDDGSVLDAATVLVGCGVEPNDELARDAGVYCNGGIVADRHGRTSVPWIWAAGDVATFVSPFTGRRQRIEHWDVANRLGTVTGANMVGVPAVNTDAPYFWSDQYGHRLQMYGRHQPGDQFVVRPGVTTAQFVAFWVRDGRVTAAAAIDSPKELRATKPLIEGRVPVMASDLIDPAVSLRALGRVASSTKPDRDGA
uniref:Dibenzofuran 4,4a-dioxygenase ferredoxin reductase n=1 Tax=Nocardioides sp. DF412 TaxID=490627 RepID=B0I4X2_9ACTN|nr:dibenzofuran 4,4a-dioxygenase ferredoxin reductase [Nocardioides sp. DF412]